MAERASTATLPRVFAALAAWSSLRIALVIGGGSRLLLLAMLAAQSQLQPPPAGALPMLCRWDCEWYIDIAQHGYAQTPRDDGQANWAFFPAYPLLVRALSWLSHTSALSAGVVLSMACFVAGLVLLHRHCVARMSAPGALFVVAAMSVSPFSIYYNSAFTEGLFFLLGMIVMSESSAGSYRRAALVAAVMAATRPSGLVAVLIILEAMWSEGVLRRRWQDAIAVCAIGASGLVAHMVYLWVTLGDPLAWVHIQSAWERSPRLVLQGIEAALQGSLLHQYALICLVGALLTAMLLLWYRERALALLISANTFLPAMTSLGSIQRYAFAGAPLYVALGHLTERRRALRPTLLILLVIASWGFTRDWLLSIPDTM